MSDLIQCAVWYMWRMCLKWHWAGQSMTVCDQWFRAPCQHRYELSESKAQFSWARNPLLFWLLTCRGGVCHTLWILRHLPGIACKRGKDKTGQLQEDTKNEAMFPSWESCICVLRIKCSKYEQTATDCSLESQNGSRGSKDPSQGTVVPRDCVVGCYSRDCSSRRPSCHWKLFCGAFFWITLFFDSLWLITQ